jgi:MFS family permease
MLVSGLIVAYTPNYFVLMVGRALIGVVVGGFWSMSAATVTRLVPERDVPRALYYRDGRVPQPGIILLGRVTGDVSIFDRPGPLAVRVERID